MSLIYRLLFDAILRDKDAGGAGGGDAKGGGDANGAGDGATKKEGDGQQQQQQNDGKSGDAGKQGDGKTIAGGGAGDGTKVVHANYPENWRQEFAGEDKDALKTLERMQAPADLWKAYQSLRHKVSSGEYKATSPFPEKGTPEQQNAWRKEQGIPEKPEAYEIKLPDGVVLGEADKPIVDSFKTFAHGKNWNGAQLNDALSWYYAEQDKMIAGLHKRDEEHHTSVNDALHATWGNDYRKNINALGNLFSDAPKGLFDKLMAARFYDDQGKPMHLVGDDQDAVVFFSKLGLERFPVSTSLPHGGQKAISDRFAEIESWMKSPSGSENWKKYWKDDKVQAEYREHLAHQEKTKARAA